MNQEPQLSDDEAAALGAASLCCCFLGVIGLVLLLVLIFRKPKGGGPAGGPGGPAVARAVGGPHHGELHLCVLAVGLDASVRDGLAAHLATPIAAFDAVQLRVGLVQRLAGTLLSVEPAWRYFGYGERELLDLGTAEQSYRQNVEEFRTRSAAPADPLGTVAVLTLVLASRAPPHGVTRLDDPSQLRALLQGWQRIDAATLLGAEYVWAPPVGALGPELLAQRFPEMHRLAGR